MGETRYRCLGAISYQQVPLTRTRPFSTRATTLFRLGRGEAVAVERPSGVKFGFEKRFFLNSFFQPDNTSGDLYFGPSLTALDVFNPDSSQGNGLASMLLGSLDVNSSGVTARPHVASKSGETAFYVQDRFHLATADAIRQTSFASAGFAAGSFTVQAFIVRRLTLLPQRLLSIGLAICVLGIGGSLATPSSAGLIAAFSVMGVGYGLAQSGLTAAASVLGGEHRQGLVAGRLQVAMSAAWIAGALGGTALYPLAIAAPLLVASGAMTLALLLSQAIGYLLNPRKRAPPLRS